ncbi:MAG: hypothetical protein AMS21_01810 [Gemmatimonas sp. SG8_38_2]|nr:MAG: hypothetical protein AMS21_01810 [Gemmatimonas sp. SG8_38_2]
MKLELGSWRVWELWEQEWPKFQQMWMVYWADRAFWKAVNRRGPYAYLRQGVPEGERGWVRAVLHEAMDFVTETIRLAGNALAVFAYSLAHLLVVALIIWIMVVGWQVGYVAGTY